MKNTPRDFFVHVGAFASLYLSAIALITLLFRMVDYLIPDALRGMYYYSDPYSGPMRFAIASLIILLPMSLFLMRLIQQEARREPMRYTLGVRRWLIFITLFIAGATIVGDLIALLNSFLGGTLATAFFLKVLALLVVVGVIFWYFILDIRGYWRERMRASHLVGFGALGAVAIIIVGGFFIMGSPLVQRGIRLDRQAIQDLTGIQQEVVSYWQRNGTLPESLSVLESDITGFHIPPAPEGRSAYEYRLDGTTGFLLCATFAAPSDEYTYTNELPMYGLLGDGTWDHDVGRACFKRRIDPTLVQPFPPAQKLEVQ